MGHPPQKAWLAFGVCGWKNCLQKGHVPLNHVWWRRFQDLVTSLGMRGWWSFILVEKMDGWFFVRCLMLPEGQDQRKQKNGFTAMLWIMIRCSCHVVISIVYIFSLDHPNFVCEDVVYINVLFVSGYQQLVANCRRNSHSQRPRQAPEKWPSNHHSLGVSCSTGNSTMKVFNEDVFPNISHWKKMI